MPRFVFLCAAWLADMAVMALLGPLGRHPVVFGVLYALGFVLLLLLVSFFPADLTPRRALAVVFGLGIGARVLFVFFPVHNDVFRYVWEGHIQNLGFNPYALSPDSPLLAEVARGPLNAVWEQINHKDFSAAYPPLSILFFRVLAGLTPDPRFFKIVLTALDLCVVVVLSLLLRLRDLPPRRLLLYAANPLVIVFVAGEGHLEPLQLFFLCLGIYLILKKSETAGFISLGLAVSAKYFAIAAFPFLITVKNGKKSLAALLPLLVTYLPFLDADRGLFQSVAAFASGMHYNDSITVFLRYFFADAGMWLAVLLLLGALSYIFLTVPDTLKSLYLGFGCLLVFLPTLHPWYLMLVAPFVVFFPSKAWLYLMAAVAFTFPVVGVEHQSGVFQEIHGLKFFEYLPFYGLLTWALFRDGLLFRGRSFPRPQSVSVVIPTLNESKNIENCLKSLRNCDAVREVVVSDGGSQDGTPEIAQSLGAIVVEGQKGRGLQIKQGIARTSGDVVLVLHADCILEKNVIIRIIEALGSDPGALGGAVGMHFEGGQIRSRLISLLNNLRARISGISFGDQAQFFRAGVLPLTGGFPAVALMEDVEFSMRLKAHGRVLFLRDGVRVSNRRWRKSGYTGNVVLVLRLFLHYLIERRLHPEGLRHRDYYQIYYAGK